MDFATLEKTPEAVVGFANKYGDLQQITGDSEETIKGWFESIDYVRSLVALGEPGAKWDLGYDDPFHPHGGRSIWGHLYLCPGPTFVYWPQALYGAIQLQATMAVASGTRFVRCTQCSRHIPLTPKMRPDGPYYCSDTCKVQSYRERKAAAVEMVTKQGKSVADVAASLGSSVSTVTGWVGTAKPKRRSGISLDVDAVPPTKPAKKGKTDGRKK